MIWIWNNIHQLHGLILGYSGALQPPLPHLAWVLLFESRSLLEEEFEGVAELRASPRPAVLAWVNDLPAAGKQGQRPCQSSLRWPSWTLYAVARWPASVLLYLNVNNSSCAENKVKLYQRKIFNFFGILRIHLKFQGGVKILFCEWRRNIKSS